MQIWIIRLIFALIALGFGAATFGLKGGAVGFFVAIALTGIEAFIKKSSHIRDIFACFAGLMCGLIATSLIVYISKSIRPEIDPIFAGGMALFFSYVGLMTIYRRRDDFAVFQIAQRKKETTPNYKIMDTSVIIDGRIREIVQAGFIDGTMLLPRFVLNELQRIADSSDSLRREKGRRGFEILKSMQKDPHIEIENIEDDFDETSEVDAKLIQLARKLNGDILTNDFNLNKVAELQGISVLNINVLANAVRPNVVAGEVITVRITREGKEARQGVGYLDDGTMIVVEEARSMIGKTVKTVVTQTLQTSAGRMIFCRVKENESESDESSYRSHSRGWNRKPNGRSSY